MRKSEFIQKMIDIKKEIEKKEGSSTITMNYIHYLEEQKMLVEIGNIEISEDKS